MSDFLKDAEQIANKLRTLGQVAPQKAKSGLAAAASAISSQAKALAPRRTGHLKHSISQSVYPVVGGMKAVIGTNVHYVVVTEEGTNIYPIIPTRRKTTRRRKRTRRYFNLNRQKRVKKNVYNIDDLLFLIVEKVSKEVNDSVEQIFKK
ncbi:MAG: HK97 gp10 family phage protein [Candidatus Coatesbacteria bacterium]|nr:HK97 gp10 family phage protein [Candidatus Coatesbacteria bacterium]